MLHPERLSRKERQRSTRLGHCRFHFECLGHYFPLIFTTLARKAGAINVVLPNLFGCTKRWSVLFAALIGVTIFSWALVEIALDGLAPGKAGRTKNAPRQLHRFSSLLAERPEKFGPHRRRRAIRNNGLSENLPGAAHQRASVRKKQLRP